MQNLVEFHRANRVAGLTMSEIVQVSEAAARKRAAGHDVLALSTGEPDFPTPDHICQAAVAAMQNGQTRYPPTAGTPALRAAVAENAGFPAESHEVIVSTGAKQVLSNLYMASLNEGDEVIIPAPYWTSYSDIVSVAGGRAIVVPCAESEGYKISPAKLEAAITPKTRWLLLNSPSNPTGAMYTEAELAGLADVLRKHPEVWIVSDEIYQHIAYTRFTSFRTAAPDLANRTLVVNGVSKAHSMTGWRIGWGIGPAELIKAMIVVQGQSTSGASSISQAAAVAALTGDNSHLEARRKAFQDRRDFVVAELSAVPGLSCRVPDGAFYVFPSCTGVFGTKTPDGTMISTDADFCHYLLAAEGLAVVPGRAFGLPGHFRLSYAYSNDALADGCARISRAVAQLTRN